MAGVAGYYESHAAQYAEIEPEPVWREQLEKFAAGLTPGCRILDLGCGAGHDAHWLGLNGFDVQCIDGSEAMAREAKKRYGIDVRIHAIEDLAARNEFDAVWASASIHHVDRQAIPSAVAAVANALRPGGQFYSSYKVLQSDIVDCLGRYYAATSEAELKSTMESAGLSIEKTVTIPGMGADGNPADFICITAKKSAY